MGFFKKLLDINSQDNMSNSATQEAPKSSKHIPMNKKKINDFVAKAIAAVKSQSDNRQKFERPEYNLWEIKEASEADSYIKIALSKYSYLIYKEGFSLKGKDENVSYIEQRFRMMSFATQKPIDILFQEVADDLVRYSNAFLIKQRVKSIPTMESLTPIFNNKVVGGYFRADPASIIRIKRDANGNITKYEQGYGDNKREFNPHDVIHFYLDRDANNTLGTPRIIAALEDVKLLRKIEGNISALIYRFSMPLYQWIVGLPQPGMGGTDPEIDKAKMEIENSSLDGIIVTSERTNIKAIGAEGNALNAEGYLKYFEDRAFTALGVSQSQMGRGGAKQDADSMEAQIHDTVKYIQRVMSIFIRECILNELLLEKGYNPIINEEDIVEYEFEEISLETKIKKENHELLKYQSNITSISESRRRMGYKDLPDDQNKLYKRYIETTARLKEIDRTAQHQKELTELNIKSRERSEKRKEKIGNDSANNQNMNSSNNNSGDIVSTANKKPRASKDQGVNKAVQNINMPTNQHGTTSMKVKESFDERLVKDVYKDDINTVYYKALEEIKDGESYDLVLPLTYDTINSMLERVIELNSNNGIADAWKEINENIKNVTVPNIPVNLQEIKDSYKDNLEEIFKTINKGVKDNKEEIEDIFRLNEYRIKFLEDYYARKAYWFSFVKAGELMGVDEAYIKFSSEKDAEGREEKINTHAFTLEDIPAYHSFCNSIITYVPINKNKK